MTDDQHSEPIEVMPGNGLAVIAGQLDDLEFARLSGQDPVLYVVAACAQARAWLAEALDRGDIGNIVELRCQATAIAAYTRQKRIGKDAELAATEIVRRAERSISVAIRRGQEAGTIETPGEGKARGPSPDGAHGHDLGKPKPTDFAKRHELRRDSKPGFHAIGDEVPDEVFEAAIDVAKAEGNLARANVHRKIKGEPPKPKMKRPEHERGRPHIKADRMIEETVLSLHSHAQVMRQAAEMGLSLTEGVEPEAWWIVALDEAMPKLRAFHRLVKGLYR